MQQTCMRLLFPVWIGSWNLLNTFLPIWKCELKVLWVPGRVLCCAVSGLGGQQCMWALKQSVCRNLKNVMIDWDCLLHKYQDCTRGCVPNGTLLPYVVRYLWPEPYYPWSKVVHYVGNRGAIWATHLVYVVLTDSWAGCQEQMGVVWCWLLATPCLTTHPELNSAAIYLKLETLISLTSFKHQLSEQLTDYCTCT